MNKKMLIMGLIVFIIFVIIIIFKNDNNERIIYLSNGRMYYYDGNKDVELGRGELKSIVYSNIDNNVFLYKVENDLYLYNKKRIKIIENVKDYEFIEDNKIVLLDIKNNLYIYDNSLKKINDSIKHYLGISDNKLLYIKSFSLFSYDFNSSKELEIVSGITNAYLTNDKKNIVYNDSKKLIIYNLNTNKKYEIKDAFVNFCDDSCTKMYYLDTNNNLYYYEKDENKLIAKEVDKIVKQDIIGNYVVYTKKEDNNTYINIDNMEEKVLSDGYVDNIISVNNRIYFHNNKKDTYFIDRKKLEIKKVEKDNFNLIKSSNNKLIYTIENSLYYDDKIISKNVLVSSIKVDEANNIIYYLSIDNKLYRYYKNKEEYIDANVYLYYAFSNKKIYYIKDYMSTKEFGDLYIYKNKSIKIKEKVKDIINYEYNIE